MSPRNHGEQMALGAPNCEGTARAGNCWELFGLCALDCAWGVLTVAILVVLGVAKGCWGVKAKDVTACLLLAQTLPGLNLGERCFMLFDDVYGV